MYDIDKFVVVGNGGLPKGFPTADAAVQQLNKIMPLFISSQESIDALAGDLAHYGYLHKINHNPDCTPRMASIFKNVAERPIENFINAHLWQLPLSHAYARTALLAWECRQGPRVGDYCERPGEDTPFHSTYSRFTHDWDDSIQTGGGHGSYHITQTGMCSYSGGLDPSIDKKTLYDTGVRRWATFWFFKDGSSGAHRGIDFLLPVRVFGEQL